MTSDDPLKVDHVPNEQTQSRNVDEDKEEDDGKEGVYTVVVVTIMVMSSDQTCQSQIGGNKDYHWQDHSTNASYFILDLKNLLGMNVLSSMQSIAWRMKDEG